MFNAAGGSFTSTAPVIDLCPTRPMGGAAATAERPAPASAAREAPAISPGHGGMGGFGGGGDGGGGNLGGDGTGGGMYNAAGATVVIRSRNNRTNTASQHIQRQSGQRRRGGRRRPSGLWSRRPRWQGRNPGAGGLGGIGLGGFGGNGSAAGSRRRRWSGQPRHRLLHRDHGQFRYESGQSAASVGAGALAVRLWR